MRDINMTQAYIKGYMEQETGRIDKFETKLKNNEVPEARVSIIKKAVHQMKVNLMVAKYSAGIPIPDLENDYINIVREMPLVWPSDWYEEMLWMLSVGVMLEVSNEVFQILADLVATKGKQDWLYYFIIHSRISSTNYKDKEVLFQPYKVLKDIVADEENIIKKLEKYLSKTWYQGHKDAGWYDSHTLNQYLYFGYWSFESGAIVKILGLDDGVLKNCRYYPYDMVHYKD